MDVQFSTSDGVSQDTGSDINKEPDEPADITESKLILLDDNEYPASEKNIDGVYAQGMMNSEVEQSSQNESEIFHSLQNYINCSCNKTLCNCGDTKMQQIQTCDTENYESKEYRSSTKCKDPFDLSAEEQLSSKKSQPMKRKLLHRNNKLKEVACYAAQHMNLPTFKLADVHKDTTDPFYIPTHDQQSPREKYKPVKRRLCSVNHHSNLSKDPVIESETVKVCDTELEVDTAEAFHQNVPEIRSLKTAFRVTYVHNQELLTRTNKLIRIEGRAELVHSLINAFGLQKYLELASPRIATDVEILGFHCPDYITFLQKVSLSGHVGDEDKDDDDEDSDIDVDDICNSVCKEAENYGLSYDCPMQKGIYETCCLISGATIVAAEKLINNTADIAINWYGGWHHAKRDSASGFCYINDIVLGILKLREKFDRVLYVDLDLHHGDGVEEAFYMTPKVMTVSFHKHSPGFFPGSGSVDDVGTGKGMFYSINVPLLDGIGDAKFFTVFSRVMQHVKERFQPQAVVIQCGADSLSADPMASFNLTSCGVSECVEYVMMWKLPTLLLGGGGYNFANTAKCWTALTSLAVQKKIPQDIPEHENFLAYGPDYEMSVTAGNRKDCNTDEYLENLLTEICSNLSSIKET